MSICPKCNGAGVIVLDNGRKAKCNFCFGRGMTDRLLEQTNEEWLRTATTEQLAEEVYKLVWCSNELFQQMECSGIDTKENDLKIVMRWLKQPHTPKE